MLWTNLGISLVAAAGSQLAGSFWNFALVFLPVIWLAGMGGIWLFYVQHQFEGVYWARDDEWNYVASALLGASYYKLPRILQWFSGNIGFHHIHHLSSKIPNYRLEKCHIENELFSNIKPIPFLKGFSYINLKLWDSKAGKLIRFKDLKMARVS